MLELVVQVLLLLLSMDHVHDFTVLRQAGGTLGAALRVTLKAVLVEGVAAQEMHRWQLQSAGADATLGLLEDLGTKEKKHTVEGQEPTGCMEEVGVGGAPKATPRHQGTDFEDFQQVATFLPALGMLWAQPGLPLT